MINFNPNFPSFESDFDDVLPTEAHEGHDPDEKLKNTNPFHHDEATDSTWEYGNGAKDSNPFSHGKAESGEAEEAEIDSEIEGKIEGMQAYLFEHLAEAGIDDFDDGSEKLIELALEKKDLSFMDKLRKIRDVYAELKENSREFLSHPVYAEYFLYFGGHAERLEIFIQGYDLAMKMGQKGNVSEADPEQGD